MSTPLEILNPEHKPQGKVRTVIFDFDGTFSTLRCGWEKVMKKLMLELISGGNKYNKKLEEKVDAYIDSSTGIQTVYQMEWLKNEVEKAGFGKEDRDVWWYKDEYNRRLMDEVNSRIARLEDGEDKPQQYLIAGAVEFLKALKEMGINAYLASGTDHKDVVHEATILGVADMFTEIKGAPEYEMSCSKGEILKKLIEENGESGNHLLVIGDGKVEIALGVARGAFTLGVATDEEKRYGLNPVKKARLQKAGADAIIGDFENIEELLTWIK